MGATAVKVSDIQALEQALTQAKSAPGPFVVVIDTDPYPSTPDGGHWWDVAVPEVSDRDDVADARRAYEAALRARLN